MKSLYVELFKTIDKLSYEQTLSTFVCMPPKEWNSSLRLMLVGRAPNGWAEDKNSYEYLPREQNAFAEKAVSLFKNSERWRWIPPDNKIQIFKEGKVSSYYINRSPFWNYTKEIYQKLSDGRCSDRWFESIAWSNLYKLAPKEWNPSEESKEIQQGICSKILDQEIKTLEPTHILFETGWDWIFKDIQNALNKESVGKYVQASGIYLGAKCVVTCRPEYKKKQDFVECVFRSFSAIK